MRRFVQEAKAASALSHPNVAHIYEIGEANGTNFIAMEYVEGQTLDAKLKGRALETAEIIDIATQVADALDEAHSKGITHRDIKPSNHHDHCAQPGQSAGLRTGEGRRASGCAH